MCIGSVLIDFPLIDFSTQKGQRMAYARLQGIGSLRIDFFKEMQIIAYPKQPLSIHWESRWKEHNIPGYVFR